MPIPPLAESAARPRRPEPCRTRLQHLYDHGMRCYDAAHRAGAFYPFPIELNTPRQRHLLARFQRAQNRFLAVWQGTPHSQRPTRDALLRAYTRGQRASARQTTETAPADKAAEQVQSGG
jgi:hypothetical protein